MSTLDELQSQLDAVRADRADGQASSADVARVLGLVCTERRRIERERKLNAVRTSGRRDLVAELVQTGVIR